MNKYFFSSLIFLSYALPSFAINPNDHSTWKHELKLKHLESKGVGFNKGYSTFEYLMSRNWDLPEFLFNVKGHVFNDGKVAGNVGLGLRHPVGDNYLLGGNVFYDVREITSKVSQQMGVGFECFHEFFDIRLNGYVPFGEWSHFHRKRKLSFKGNVAWVNEKIYSVLPSIQAEIGVPLNNLFYIAAGPYYLFERKVERTAVGNALGGYFRMVIDTQKHVSLTGIATYDPIFKTTIQGVIAFNIPLGKKREKEKTSQENSKRSLKYLPLYRNEIIPIEIKQRQYILGDSEHPDDLFSFVFVNNSFKGLGDGTFEKPFSSLKEAENQSAPGDIIYVFPGNRTAEKMNEGIVLKKDQVLASTSSSLTIDDFTIPPLTPGNNPVITNVHLNEPLIQGPGKFDLTGFDILNSSDPLFWGFDSAFSNIEMPYFNIPVYSGSNTQNREILTQPSSEQAPTIEITPAPASPVPSISSDWGIIDAAKGSFTVQPIDMVDSRNSGASSPAASDMSFDNVSDYDVMSLPSDTE